MAARRIGPYVSLRPGARVLDVGAAQGLAMVAFERAGYEAYGVEPWPQAIDASRVVAARTGTDARILEGAAESLPFPPASFDLVHAHSVLEHVEDPAAVFAEAQRVLCPGGGFYFYTTSALCPRQREIRRFPLFPWYPRALKRAIMDWAVRSRPSLVGGTTAPAYHWFTPWGVRSALASAGFRRTVDRWELRLRDGGTRWRTVRLGAVRSSRTLRLLADVAVQDSFYLAIK